jgi:hypothetical protein
VNTLTYVFCLVRKTRRPALPKIDRAHSLPGSRDMRALPAGDDVWLIATTVPADDYNETALMKGLLDLDWVGRRALAHETAVEQFLSATAVLPMQLFTLFTSDERALEHVVRQRKEILGILKRIEQKVEWGLRLTFDETAVRDPIESAARSATKGAPRSAPASGKLGATSGTAYLARKRDLLEVTRGQLQAARREAERLFKELKKEAADSRRRNETEQASAGARLLLDAAFLVPASRGRAFRAAVARHAKTIGGSGIVVSLTGPWPPYNFISPPASAKDARGNV